MYGYYYLSKDGTDYTWIQTSIISVHLFRVNKIYLIYLIHIQNKSLNSCK